MLQFARVVLSSTLRGTSHVLYVRLSSIRVILATTSGQCLNCSLDIPLFLFTTVLYTIFVCDLLWYAITVNKKIFTPKDANHICLCIKKRNIPHYLPPYLCNNHCKKLFVFISPSLVHVRRPLLLSVCNNPAPFANSLLYINFTFDATTLAIIVNYATLSRRGVLSEL